MKYFILLSVVFLLFSCDTTTETIEFENELALIPYPKEITESSKGLQLSDSSKIYVSNDSLNSIAFLFRNELRTLTNVFVEISKEKDSKADVVFTLDKELGLNTYSIVVESEVNVRGGSVNALLMAKTTLLQLVEVQDEKLIFPIVSIKDSADSEYRGLMLDLARQEHTLEDVKQVIDLAAFYKTNYLHLHFSDYQAYTLPSTKYPKLTTSAFNYSWDELKWLESYSQERGVTIIPEIDIPGHSSPFVNAYPELFAIADVKDNPWIIHMGRDATYKALDDIIGELVGVFKSSPYFHIGGDEAIFDKVTKDETIQEYMKKHELGEDVHELYRHFLVRINDIVKKHNKQMCVWEGFRKEGTVEIPKDILVFAYETNRYLPNELVADGYSVINTSWKPLYVVNQKKWEPKTIYAWNLYNWGNWLPSAPSFTPIQLEKSALVKGAEMCAWEQAGKTEFPSLRKRLPAMNERIWNIEKVRTYDAFMDALSTTNEKLSLLSRNVLKDPMLVNYNFVKEDEN
jgi:hexosaminidase